MISYAHNSGNGCVAWVTLCMPVRWFGWFPVYQLGVSYTSYAIENVFFTSTIYRAYGNLRKENLFL